MRLQAGEGVVWNAVEGELVLLNADTGVYYALDGVGSEIWRLIQEPLTISEAKARLAADYEADGQTISADVDRLVAELLVSGLLVQTADAS